MLTIVWVILLVNTIIMMDMENNKLKNNLCLNWIEWLVGFCEGDGNFQVDYDFSRRKEVFEEEGNLESYDFLLKELKVKNKVLLINGKIPIPRVTYSINISLGIVDLQLLKDIQKKLNGIGIIYEYPDRKEARLSIRKKKDLLWLIDNVFNIFPLLTFYQRDRYFRLKYGILNNITKFNTLRELFEFKTKYFSDSEFKIELVSLDSTQKNQINNNKETILLKDYLLSKYQYEGEIENWILGIINSEGCFYSRLKKDDNRLLVFQIEHTDLELIKLFKAKFKFTPTVFERAERSVVQKNTYSLYVSSKNNISTLIKFCDNPALIGLQGNKKIQYENWKITN